MNMNINNELKDEYLILIKKGYTTKQISEKIQMPWSTVKGHFNKLGLKTNYKSKLSPISKEVLISFLEKKCSVKQISCALS